MNYPDDTIAAIATPAGEGGIGIVRMSGKDAVSITDRIFISPRGKKLATSKSHTIIYGHVADTTTGRTIDEVLVAVMRAPKTYTREDIVEINCHGGAFPLGLTLQQLLKEGARLAEPGEFTKRAFLNGRMDLSQAEAVIDIISAKTEQAERLALQQLEGRISKRIDGLRDMLIGLCGYIEAHIDFPEEEPKTAERERIAGPLKEVEGELESLLKGYDEGRLFREGVSLAIVGKPNVGKSSLLNAMLQKDRAIVTDIPGTTRDIIEDFLNVNGLPVRVMDTAGIRESHDLAEAEGVKRSLKAIEGADMVLAVLDASAAADEADIELLEKVKDKKTVLVFNKADIESPGFPGHAFPSSYPLGSAVRVSALRGEGIDMLREKIYSLLVTRKVLGATQAESSLITNIRHKRSVEMSLLSLQRAAATFANNEPLEVTALLMREALDYLGEIAGITTTEDILNRIFSEFCVGK